MGQSRHPLPALVVCVAVALVAAAVGGCGSSGAGSSSEQAKGASGAAGSATTPTAPAGASAQACAGAVRGIATLRVAGVGCAIGRGVVASWSNRPACAGTAAASRVSCTVEDYRCLGAATDRGLAVSCARPYRSISFVAKRTS
jgi:hypothetical protein